jgi:hypothetical protein
MNQTNRLSITLQLREIERQAIFYFGMLVAIPGLVMNAINLIIFSRKAIQINMRFFHKWLCIADSLNLIGFFIIFYPREFSSDLTILMQSLFHFY